MNLISEYIDPYTLIKFIDHNADRSGLPLLVKKRLKVVYILLHAVAYKTMLVVYMYKIKGLASISNPHVFQAKMPFLFSGLTATPFFILEETHPSCVVLVCCMYWNGVLYVLDWCVVCTQLVCCMRGRIGGGALPLHLW